MDKIRPRLADFIMAVTKMRLPDADHETTYLFGSNRPNLPSEDNIDVIKQILEEGRNVNDLIQESFTPLYLASSEGDLALVRLLLDREAEVNKVSQGEKTPLYIACKTGHLDIVKTLLDSGADVNKPDQNGDTPLYTASEYGRVDILRILLDRGAEVNSSTGRETPLFVASVMGYRDIVRILLDNGADIDRTSPDGNTPLLIACVMGYLNVVQILLEAGANVNKSRPGSGETPLLTASKTGRLDIVHTLLDRGADVNTRTDTNDTCLNAACQNGHYEVVKALLEKGAEPTHCTISYKKGFYNVFVLLLDKIARPNMGLNSFLNIAYFGYDDDVADACIERCVPTSCLSSIKPSKQFKQHLVKLQVVGLFNGGIFVDQETLNKYNTEIKHIKEYKLVDDVSLYIVFQRYRAPYYLRKRDLLNQLENILNSPSFLRQFPLYGGILKNRFLSSKHRLSLLTKISKSLEEQEWWDKLPLLLQQKILNYLDTVDLEKM